MVKSQSEYQKLNAALKLGNVAPALAGNLDVALFIFSFAFIFW